MDIRKLLPGVQKNILLKNYTAFKIGGPAKYFFAAKTKEDLIKAVITAKKLKLPFFILGGGSNLLVSDKGFQGLVIKTQNTKYQILNTKIFAEAGIVLGQLVNIAMKAGFTGLEWAAGIPGQVGGAVCGNAGAFGGSMNDIIKEVEVFDTKQQKIKILKNKDCKFNYRGSIFKKNKNLIILSTTLQLKKGNKEAIKNRIQKNLKKRKTLQPVNFPSAGSVFKNPSGFSAGELGEENKSSSSATEALAEVKKRTKFSSPFAAARLIEECGLKGKKIGRAKISEKHANFIVNLGGALAKDVVKLINFAKKKVKNKFKILLEEEIQHLGF